MTGATGEPGSRIVTHLLDRVPAHGVAISVCDVDKAADFAARGVSVRRRDFSDPSSLSGAFEGATQVLVVSAGGTDVADNHHGVVIDAAIAAGAERVTYTRHQGEAPKSFFDPMPNHYATEKYLAASGTAYTSLRNGFYANFVPRLIGLALIRGVLLAPADGRVSWTTHPDLAEVAAAILAEPDKFEGPTPPFTAATRST